MRYPIWMKDDVFRLGEKIIEMDPEIVQLGELEEETDLFWHFNHEAPRLGYVKDILLEDGEITGEVVFEEAHNSALAGKELLEHGDVRLGGYYSDVVRSDGRVHSCRLRSVSLTMMFGGANPVRKT